MKRINLIRLSLFQMGFGIMLGFLLDTLNRVMTTELGISATIVFGLISLKELLAILGVKVWAGNLSDRSQIFGLKRTPYVLIGLLCCVFSFMLAPAAAYEVKVGGIAFSELLPAMMRDVGLLKLAVIFLVFGFGLQVATTAYYALLADTVGEENIGKVTGASWTLMVLTTIVSTRIVGSYLDVFTPERLITVAEVGGLIALGIGLFAVVGVEQRNAETKEGKSKHAISFSQSIMLLSSSPKTLLFASYIFISIFALFANDYIKKPFEFEELLARIRVQLRNKNRNDDSLNAGILNINPATHQVFCASTEVTLTPKEFALLEYLVRNKDRVCTRSRIIEHVWDIHFDSDTSVIDVYITFLRRKLEAAGCGNIIQTIRGVGYIVREPEISKT